MFEIETKESTTTINKKRYYIPSKNVSLYSDEPPTDTDFENIKGYYLVLNKLQYKLSNYTTTGEIPTISFFSKVPCSDVFLGVVMEFKGNNNIQIKTVKRTFNFYTTDILAYANDYAKYSCSLEELLEDNINKIEEDFYTDVELHTCHEEIKNLDNLIELWHSYLLNYKELTIEYSEKAIYDLLRLGIVNEKVTDTLNKVSFENLIKTETKTSYGKGVTNRSYTTDILSRLEE